MKKIAIITFTLLLSMSLPSLGNKKQNYLITRSSVGKIKLGFSVKQVLKILGKPKSVKNWESGFCDPNEPESSSNRHVKANEYNGLTVLFYKGVVVKIIVRSPKYHTKEGIRVNMSVKDLEKIYGAKVGEHGCTGGNYIEGEESITYDFGYSISISKGYPCDDC